MKTLKNMIVWLIWKKDPTGRKVPCYPDGKYGLRWKDPGNLISYKEAGQAAYYSWADGLGIVLPEGYYCIDLDDVDPSQSNVKDLISYCDSYTERSPSGRGIHIVVKSDVPKTKNLTFKSKSGLTIEVKRSGTFITYTGEYILNVPIKDHTSLIQETYDRIVENESCVSSQAAATDKAKMKHNADGGLLTQTVTHQYTKAALDGECHKIRAATKGTRRRTIFIAALKLRKYIGKGLDEAEFRNALNDAGNYHRLPARSINEQIENGLAAA